MYKKKKSNLQPYITQKHIGYLRQYSEKAPFGKFKLLLETHCQKEKLNEIYYNHWELDIVGNPECTN